MKFFIEGQKCFNFWHPAGHIHYVEIDGNNDEKSTAEKENDGNEDYDDCDDD